METPVETEIKLLAAPGMLEALRHHPLLAASETRASLVTGYFDTLGGSLRRAGGVLRLRTGEDGTRQTLKLPMPGGPVISQAEWTVPAPANRLDPALFPAPARALLDPLLGGAAVACFARNRVERTTRRLHFGQSLIEAAFDCGTIHARDREEPLVELELELIAGQSADLFALALRLPLGPDLRWSVTGKAARAQALAYDLPLAAVRAAALHIPPSASLAQALRSIGWNGLQQWLANAPLVLASADPEPVHQLRVALRRLRTMLRLFAAGQDAAVLAAELKAVADALAPARDLHLLQERVATPRSVPPSAALVAQLARQQGAALEAARQLLAGEACQQLQLRLALWLEGAEGVATLAQADRPFAAVADRALARQLERVNDRDKPLAALSRKRRHRLRIAVKTLRYGAEFRVGPEPGRGRRRFSRALERLQDRLGQLNDLALAAAPPAGLFGDRDPITAARLKAELTGLERPVRHHKRRLLKSAERARAVLKRADVPWNSA